MNVYPRHAGHIGSKDVEMDMSGMDMGDSSSSSNSTSSSMGMMMAMVFQTSTSAPLYANSWTPNSAGAYAGTCLFLVLLSVAARLLVALKAAQERRWSDRDARRRYVVVSGKEPLAERLAAAPGAGRATLTLSENGVEEAVVVVAAASAASAHGGDVTAHRPWRFSVDPLRAALDTMIVGVGYLLMLAVMTMNVGYFMSVLAGTFIGSLCVGRYSPLPFH